MGPLECLEASHDAPPPASSSDERTVATGPSARAHANCSSRSPALGPLPRELSSLPVDGAARAVESRAGTRNGRRFCGCAEDAAWAPRLNQPRGDSVGRAVRTRFSPPGQGQRDDLMRVTFVRVSQRAPRFRCVVPSQGWRGPVLLHPGLGARHQYEGARRDHLPCVCAGERRRGGCLIHAPVGGAVVRVATVWEGGRLC